MQTFMYIENGAVALRLNSWYVIYTTLQLWPFQVTASQENSVLKDVSQTVIQAGKSLEETANNKKRLNCLRKLSKCYRILMWIGTVGNGKSSYQFVM